MPYCSPNSGVKMKIVVISMHRPGSNGVATSLWNFACILSSLGHELRFVTETSVAQSLCSEKYPVKVIGITPKIFPRSLLWSFGKRFFQGFFRDVSPTDIDVIKFAFATKIKLKELEKSGSTDLVIFADSYMEFAYFFSEAKSDVWISLHCPRYLFQKIGINNEPVNNYLNKLETQMVPKAKILTTPSFAMARMATEYYHLSDEKIKVIHNPVSEVFLQSEIKPHANDRIGICFVGRFSREKGAEVIIKVIPDLLKKHKKLFFSVVGESAYTNEGQALIDVLAKKLELQGTLDRFLYFKNIPHKDLPGFYRQHDIFLFPTMFDSFGNVIAEAQGCGLPVVANAVGGVPEVIKDGETGFLVKNNNEEDFVAKLELLISDQNLRERMGCAARDFVRQNFSFSVIAELLKKVIA